MAGLHRKPSPPIPVAPIATGASVAAISLLVGAIVTAPNAAAVNAAPATHPLPAVRLALPPLDVASAALYLAPLPAKPVDPETESQTVKIVVPKPFTITTTGSSRAARAVNTAMGMRGVPYVWGGTSRSGVDCSGLTQLAFQSAGVALPRTAAAQASVGRSVSLSQVQAGDLLFYAYGGGISHVVMAAGGGKIVEASQPGVPVHEVPLYTSGLTSIRRIIG